MNKETSLQFREEASEAVADPDQLRAAVSYVRPHTRLLIAGLALLVLLLVVWAAWASVPLRVSGSGVLTLKGRDLSVPVMAQNTGQVDAVLVTAGQTVKPGDVVARLAQPQADAALREAQSDLRAARNKQTETITTLESAAASSSAARARRRDSLQGEVDHLASRLPFLKQQATEIQDMLERQLASKDEAERARVAWQTAEDDLSRQQAELKQLQADAANEKADLERQRAALQEEVTEAQADVNKLQSDFEKSTRVLAQQAGTIREVNAVRGDWVTSGQRVALITPEAERNADNIVALSALLYVPLDKGKRLAPGMEAQLEVSSLLRGEPFKVRAVVDSVSELAISQETLAVRLNNDAWTQQIMADGVPFEVVLNLVPDSQEVSGYAWTSSPGPQVKLLPGTFIHGQVTEERRSLLSLVVPALRVFFRADGTVE